MIDGGMRLRDSIMDTFDDLIDDLVIIVERGRTGRDDFEHELEAARTSQARLAGVVLVS